MNELALRIEDNPSPSAISLAQEELWRFNKLHTIGYKHGVYAVLARAADRVVGGAVCAWVWNWVHLESLVVPLEFRSRGIGTRLLTMAETHAIKLGCTHIHCDTFGFQSPDFYLKRGYSVFGILDDFPPNYKRFYLQKQLTATPATAQNRMS